MASAIECRVANLVVFLRGRGLPWPVTSLGRLGTLWTCLWVCNTISNSDINIISNYIFGFPDDTHETMQQTLDLALELNTEMANMYPCQALPGSPLYNTARMEGWSLPSSPEGFAFLSYECEPLRTRHLSAAQVLEFRDEAWTKYFSNPIYLQMVEKRFGSSQRENVEDMAKIKLKRKILGH